MRIVLVPVGEIPEEVLEFLAQKIVQRFECDVIGYPPLEVPEEAYVPERDQYLSSAMLNDLRGSIEDAHQDKVLWITHVDLFVRDLNFIFGEAEAAGQHAIVSLARLNQTFYGKPEDEVLLQSRLVKESVHELGHVCGLGHCPDRKCVMFFSNHIWDTDQKSSDFCPQCQQALDNLQSL